MMHRKALAAVVLASALFAVHHFAAGPGVAQQPRVFGPVQQPSGFGVRKAGLIWDPNDVRAVVDSFLTRPSEASEAATVQVLNGTAVSGLASRVSGDLERAGFTLSAPGNAPANNLPKTVVYDITGRPRTSRRLAKQLGAELRQGAPEGVTTSADVVVVVGADQAK